MTSSVETTSVFDRLTAVEDGGDGRARATISDAVSGFGGAHGGYVAAIALRAMSELVADGRPVRSLSLRMLAPVKAGDVELERRLEREGRSMSVASVRVVQDGAAAALAQASFGTAGDGPPHHAVAMPDVPAPDECRPLFDKPVPDAKAGLMVEHRPAGGPMPLSASEDAEIRVWMRLVEDRDLDPLLLAFLADSAPPALYGSLSEFIAMPSTDITLHFEPAAATDPWVLGHVRNRVAADGYAVEDGELWSPGGALLVHARQQRRILPPR